MEPLPCAFEQRLIRSFLDEGVLKEIGRLRWHPALVEELHRRRLVNDQTEQLQRRGIDLVQVFDDEQYRLRFGEREQDGHYCFQSFLLLPLGRQGQWRVAIPHGHRQ